MRTVCRTWVGCLFSLAEEELSSNHVGSCGPWRNSDKWNLKLGSLFLPGEAGDDSFVCRLNDLYVVVGSVGQYWAEPPA